MRLTGTGSIPLQRPSQNEARRPGMGKSIAKARLCQRGKGLYLTTFDLPLLNPLPLLKYTYPLPMPCHGSFHPWHHRALGNHRLCHRLSSSCLALLASLPHRLPSLVCHTGSPASARCTRSITDLHALRRYSAASPRDPASLFSELCHVLPSPCHTDSSSSLRSFA